jgi:hypothetical protein
MAIKWQEAWAAERQQSREDVERLEVVVDRYRGALRRIANGDSDYWSRVAYDALCPPDRR